MLAVTAIDRPYLPGLIALHNSIKRNSPNIELACCVYGDSGLAWEVQDRGIRTILNPGIPAKLPTSWREPVGHPAMYIRLMIPHLFGCNAAWLDADQVVLKPLDPLFELDMGDHVCAGVPSTMLNEHIRPCPDELVSLPGIYAGLLYFNHAEWMRQQITEQCLEAMNTRDDLDFFYVVQSVLGLVLRGKFKQLSNCWQGFGNRVPNEITGDTRVVHWHGHQRNPWSEDCQNMDIWKQYA